MVPNKLKEIFKSWRIWLLLIAIFLSLIAIAPNPLASGVKITGVDDNSSAMTNGVPAGAIIHSVNGKGIGNVASYSEALSGVKPQDIIKINTNKGEFAFKAGGTDEGISTGLLVSNAPKSNLKKGLDLAGGVRVLLQPEEGTTPQQFDDLIKITTKRLNTYGLSDINVRQVTDLEGNSYILVEVPGANKEEVTKLISQQGKFEAKIGNDTVLQGGADIKNVDRSQYSGIDPYQGCGMSGNGWTCRFRFGISISQEAAKRHASVTQKLGIITENGQQYLEKKLDLYLDDKLVDSLFISSDLKGSETTEISIQGPGEGATKRDATSNALKNMRSLQTILITGSLPVKISVAKVDVISPTLGDDFLQTALLAFLVATIVVGAVVFIRFRNLKICGGIMATVLCEILIILGMAAAINWKLDLASIAGILATIGTGVDSQIVITDEVLKGEASVESWKKRFKQAFFIIIGTYATTIAAMVPLWWMGAGAVRGFAITTTIGVTIGILITRPAFGKIIEVLLSKD